MVMKDMMRAYPEERVNCMLDRYDLSSYPSEERLCAQMYKAGKSLFEICEALHRPQVEVAIMLMDLADRGQLKPRKTGIFGKGEI